MTLNAMMGLVVLPALTFGVLYFPVLRRVSPGLQSPYAKANPTRWLLAAAIDVAIIAVTLYFALDTEAAWLLVPGVAYAGLRDAFAG